MPATLIKTGWDKFSSCHHMLLESEKIQFLLVLESCGLQKLHQCNSKSDLPPDHQDAIGEAQAHL